MSSRDHRGPQTGQETAPDDLDRLLSWGVQELAGAARPPARVWPRIERKLRGGPSPVRYRPGRSVWRMAPLALAQALALASLLVVLGLSLSTGLQWSPYSHGGDEREMLTRTPVAWQAGGAPLTGEGGLLSRQKIMLLAREQAHERQVMARDPFPDADPLTGEEGLSSRRKIMLLAREQAHERQVMSGDNSPGVDTIPKHGQKWRMFEEAP